MLPIKDTIRARYFPVVNWAIIILNALIFFFELSLPESRLHELVFRYGLVAQQFSLVDPTTWLPVLTHMWLHGGWLHFLSNIWILVIFGDNVEDRMGSARYAIFYLLGGVAAGLLQTLMSAGSSTPAIGASGAIAAVLGAYFLFYPRARVITMILIFIIPFFVELPALLFLGFWFVSQLFQGVLALSSTTAGGGIAWWAHIGGFLFGLVMANIFAFRRKPVAWHPDEYFPY